MCWLTNGSGKAKVTQLDHTPLGNENILWLYITMDDLLNWWEERQVVNVHHQRALWIHFMWEHVQLAIDIISYQNICMYSYQPCYDHAGLGQGDSPADTTLTFFKWQNSTPFRTCHMIFFTKFSSAPVGYLSRSSRAVWSTNSNTRNRRFFRLKTSIRLTKFSCLNCCVCTWRIIGI